MSGAESSSLRVLSFGDASGEVWGAAVSAAGATVSAAGATVSAGATALAIVTPERTVTATDADQVSLSPERDGWRLTGPDFALSFVPAGENGSRAPSPAGDLLCRVEGHIGAPEAERAVSCSGTVSLEPDTRIDRLDSIRAVTGWFDADHGVVLRALRPAGSKDHEHDAIAATLFDPDQAVAVTDPRLSTTFRPPERPARASLELWIGDGDELYPRRAAAEASGPAVETGTDGMRLAITPLRCHSAGLDGVGVYLIAHF